MYRTGGKELMAAQLRRSWELKKLWLAGEYTLLIDSYTAEDRVAYSKGETLALNQWEAARLGRPRLPRLPAFDALRWRACS